MARERQSRSQGQREGSRDRGSRTAVTGGGHCNGFAELLRDVCVAGGLPQAHIFAKLDVPAAEGGEVGEASSIEISAQGGAVSRRWRRGATNLPGYFRATKDWDVV